LVLVSNFN